MDKSKCCGSDWFYWLRHYGSEYPDSDEHYMVRYCGKCNRPSLPVEEKSKEGV